MPPAVFARLCRELHALAESRIRSDPEFIARVGEASARAERDSRRRARFAVEETPEDVEALLGSNRRPRLRLNSMGFFVLSGQPPARIA